MRGLTSAAAAVAVTAALVAVPPASAAARCDMKPIQTALAALKNINAAPGIVLTVKSPGCGVWSGGVGVADRATGRKISGDEHSRIGSDTKTWTAVVVLQLVAEGKLKLDDTVDHYLPGLVDTPQYDGREITIRDLLQHTSGLPDYAENDYWADDQEHRWDHTEPLFTVQQALTMDPPEQTASGFYYSSTNYNLAGLIVAKVTGRSIGTEITQRIIQPLGLCETYWPGDQTTIRKPDLRSYTKGVDTTEWNTSEADASGELISTGPDTTAFWAALLSGKLLPPSLLTEMKRTILDDSKQGYGLGVQKYQLTKDLVTWGHSGGMASGHNFWNAVTGDGQRSVTMLINSDGYTNAQARKIDNVGGTLVHDIR
ncbi:serine hydrolase domain-containing protein [Amycolatopsis jejuensis]|uniref:serine hydrolase domain-containing protein n=1 Tax=Amycolatopsis jejuensis TaxID=330084 RepID=UPI000526CF68|nr:serine hydrolase domain-containing protein [Amycolatopsis jejuensis]